MNERVELFILTEVSLRDLGMMLHLSLQEWETPWHLLLMALTLISLENIAPPCLTYVVSSQYK